MILQDDDDNEEERVHEGNQNVGSLALELDPPSSFSSSDDVNDQSEKCDLERYFENQIVSRLEQEKTPNKSSSSSSTTPARRLSMPKRMTEEEVGKDNKTRDEEYQSFVQIALGFKGVQL